jgi:hypothetical protein
VHGTGRDPAVLENPHSLSVSEDVTDPIARRVTSFDEGRASTELDQSPRCVLLFRCRPDFSSGEDRRLLEVGRHEVAERKEITSERADPRRRQQDGAARRKEDRVEDDVSRSVSRETFRHRPDVRGVTEHSDLHGGRGEVGKDRVELLGDEAGGEGLDRHDSAGVLSGTGGHDSRAVNAVSREGQKIRLDAGAAPRIGAGDRDGRDWTKPLRVSHPGTLADDLRLRPVLNSTLILKFSFRTQLPAESRNDRVVVFFEREIVMNSRRRSLLQVAGLAFVAIAVVADPVMAQMSRPQPQTVSDAPLVPVVGLAKEELMRTVLAAKSRGAQTLSPTHHECPGGTPHVQAITCGSTTGDQLTTTGSCQLTDQSYIDFYGFSGTAGQQVTITMTSSVFDTYLFLIRSDGTTVAAFDDDSGGGTNSRIVFALDATGTWFVGANAFDPNTVGAYTLTLECSTGACTPSSTTLCLNNGRFRVTATFLTPQGQSGDATAVPETSDTGLFWFFSSNNIEAIIKVVNACSFTAAPRYWVFAGGLTNVQVNLTVTDTSNNTTRFYTNPQGTAFAPIQDTNAFATCP